MRLKNETISFQQYIWYLIRVRGVFFLILFLAMGIRIRKIVAAFFLLWTGMSGGILLSEAVAELGMKGSILCVAGLFPQFLFYVPAVLVLLRFCWNYPQNQWNRQKTFFVCSLFLIGIFSFRQLKERTLRSSSSMVISRAFSLSSLAFPP